MHPRASAQLQPGTTLPSRLRYADQQKGVALVEAVKHFQAADALSHALHRGVAEEHGGDVGVEERGQAVAQVLVHLPRGREVLSLEGRL